MASCDETIVLHHLTLRYCTALLLIYNNGKNTHIQCFIFFGLVDALHAWHSYNPNMTVTNNVHLIEIVWHLGSMDLYLSLVTTFAKRKHTKPVVKMLLTALWHRLSPTPVTPCPTPESRVHVNTPMLHSGHGVFFFPSVIFWKNNLASHKSSVSCQRPLIIC